MTNNIQLSQLLDTTNPDSVFEEIRVNFLYFYHADNFTRIKSVFGDFHRLFEGKYPGYRACNTNFHDKLHTTDALLAISRLIDGYNILNGKLPVELIETALVSTILHDTGYIQLAADNEGTGAKYTKEHVSRSIEFMRKYFKINKYSEDEADSSERMMQCTGLDVKIETIKFRSAEERTLGLMLGAADLMGQMASRTYIERLVFLYNEFIEAGITGYSYEFDLIEKTLGFYELTKKRFKNDLKGVNEYAVYHFKERNGADRDLYAIAIERHMEYLKEIISASGEKYKKKLRRKVVVVQEKSETKEI